MEGESSSPKIEEEVKENPEELTERKSVIIKKINNCSYSKGYITQQVFACKTCYDEKKLSWTDKELNEYGEVVEPAGFWIGWLINCHSLHTAYELYSKTNFRCDWGNLKMNQQWVLNDEKEMYNEHNKYSHNFFGRYWYCNEEYNGDVAMIQWILCEDWFHFNHLNPSSDIKFSEIEEKGINWVLICKIWAAKQLDWLSKKTDIILNYDEILKAQQSKTSNNVEEEKSHEENVSEEKSLVNNIRKRTREEFDEKDDLKTIENPEYLINPNDSNEQTWDKTNPQENDRTEIKRRKLSNDESDWKDTIQEIKQWVFIDAKEKQIEGYDLFFEESFYESLCSCENKRCVDYREEILKIFKKADNCSQEESHLDEALLDDLLGLEEEELETVLQHSNINQINSPSKDEDEARLKSQENNDLFSDLVTQNYPNIPWNPLSKPPQMTKISPNLGGA